MHRSLLSAVLLLAGAACTSPETPAKPENAGIPADAVEIGEGSYMVPISADEDGCMMYRHLAPGRLVAQVIYYRTADGDFVTDKRLADCRTDTENGD